MTAVASPFDALAGTYDEEFSRTDLGLRLRRAVWRRLDDAFPPGARVLELGCGTGEDALHLAGRGVNVVATDGSEAMVLETRRKARAAGLEERITARPLRFEGLGDAAPSLGELGGAFSNFGALNCAEDLDPVAKALGRLLPPGAPLVLVPLGRWVPWEWAWFLRRGEPARAFRRLARDGSSWRGLTVRYPSPRRLRRTFAPWFRQRALTALGVLLPPSYAAPSVGPVAMATLERWERRLDRIPPLAWLSDHYVLELERR